MVTSTVMHRTIGTPLSRYHLELILSKDDLEANLNLQKSIVVRDYDN